MILTSQMPIAHWHEQIGDPTIADSILDRLVHNAYRIELAISPVPATVSFDIEWSGIIERAIVTNEDEDFTGQYVRTGATIEWSSNEAGFTFVSEPANPSRNLYSVIGHERNGVFFHGRK